MRKEEFTKGNYVHVYNRGSRRMPIVRDAKDRWHFLQMLYYFNANFTPPNPFRQLRELLSFDFNSRLDWPESWPKREPIVMILAFVLMENHFHLLLKEIQKGGIAKFMQKLGIGMANYFNTKYQETGSLFQGSYKAKLIDEDAYLNYLSAYIQVKNPFEMYPGGIEKAAKEFDKAYDFAIDYPYGSLADHAGRRNSPIIQKELLGELFPTPEQYKKFARECILGMNLDKRLGDLTFE